MTSTVGTVRAATSGCLRTKRPARTPTRPLRSDQIQGVERSTNDLHQPEQSGDEPVESQKRRQRHDGCAGLGNKHQARNDPAKPWSRKTHQMSTLRASICVGHGDNLLEVKSQTEISGPYSKAKIRFQSFFMQITVQLFFFCRRVKRRGEGAGRSVLGDDEDQLLSNSITIQAAGSSPDVFRAKQTWRLLRSRSCHPPVSAFPHRAPEIPQ